MSNRIKFGRKRMVLFFLITLGLLLQACGPSIQMQTYRRDISTYTPLASLKLKVPTGEATKTETSYMVAFVAPDYDTAMFDILKAQKEMWGRAVKVMSGHGYGVGLPTPYRRMDVAKFEYFDQIKKFLQTDLEHLLLQKNVRVLGIFKSHDEMTFDQKRRAIYTFTPQININVDTKFRSTSDSPYVEDGNIIVSGNITMTLRESLTGEKLWIKRIEADSVNKPYKFVAKYKDLYRVEHTLGIAGVPIPLGGSVAEKDDTDQVLAAVLSEFYTALGDKLWRHIETEEWSKYLDQAENVRRGKRY